MKLARFTDSLGTRLGMVEGEEILDPARLFPELPADVGGLLAQGGDVLSRLRAAAATSPRLPLASVTLEAPIARPPKFLGIGLNYEDHVAESGQERPFLPTFFNKQSTCVAGPFAPVHLPKVSPLLDYEGELGFVIGRRCRHVPRERAHEVIAGYLVVNDVTVRDWQLRIPTWTIGKSFDTHGPIGPWMVTADELVDPHSLDLRTWVNGELRQHSNTRHLIFDCFAQVEHLSTAFTLEPGDIITTGTPGGVGGAMQPPQFLKVGDRVRVEIEGVGHIENEVIAEPDETVRI